MMTNLFSIFDPSTSLWLSLNWLSTMVVIMFLPPLFWVNKNRIYITFDLMMGILMSEMKNNSSEKNWYMMPYLLSVFLFILIANVLSLLPYTFTPTSHLMISMSLGLPIWISYILFTWTQMFNKCMAHLVPLGSPMPLSFFMVLIETISLLMRPFTLAIRLSANMIAGHLLMTLLSGLPESNMILFTPCSVILILLITLEFAVSIIQSYVYLTLLTLYINEIE